MTGTNEKIFLDPDEVIDDRTELEISDLIDFEGVDYGEAAIDAYMADKDRGSIPVDYRVPNREIEIPMIIRAAGAFTAVQLNSFVQAKAALFQREGGVLKRVTNSGGTVYADIVNASYTATSVSGMESAQNVDLDASLHLECLPDWYEAEVTLSDHSETTAAELLFTETSIEGDYPARCRMVFDDDQGQDQRGIIWAFRCRHYSSASTAATRYEAEALQPLGSGTAVATTGASNGTAVKLAPLFPAWTPVAGTNIGGTTFMTHTGTNRVYVRCQTMGTTQIQARLSWDVGDLINSTTNDPVTFPDPSKESGTAGTAFYIADMGEVRLDPSPVGVHRWQGQIDAQTYNTTSGTSDFRVDRVWVVNQDEGAGVLTAPLTQTIQPETLVVFDDFSQAAGNVAAGAAPLGGNYDPGTAGASTAEDGDTDDFTFTGTGFVVRNPASADSSVTNGRYIQLDGSSTLAAQTIQIDVALGTISSASVGEIRGGVLARFVDTDNWLMLVRRNLRSGTGYGAPQFTKLALYKRVAGTVTTLANITLATNQQLGFYTVKLSVNAAGGWVTYTGPAGSTPVARNFGTDAALATAGVLDDGKAGFYDANSIAAFGNETLRIYDNFKCSTLPTATPTTDAVTFASRSTQLTTDGHYRLDTGGTAYGPVSVPTGDLPRLPVAGLEGRTTEIFLKPSRGDFDQLPDSGIDDCSARVSYRPCWLHVPNT